MHRILLAARSPVFSTLFEQEDAKEAKPARVVIKDITPTALEALVKFTHTDQIEDKDLTTNLLVAAKKYQIKVLFDKCEERLGKSLTVGNAVDYFVVAFLQEVSLTLYNSLYVQICPKFHYFKFLLALLLGER